MTRFGALVRKVDERQAGISLPLLSVSQTRGVLRQSDLSDRPPRADSLDAYKICRRGDIVFNKMSIRAGAMGVAAEDGLVTYHYEVMRPLDGANARFVSYLMKSSEFTRELIKNERGIGAGSDVSGVRTTEVPFSVMKNIDVWIPSSFDQGRIADYLDRETGKIDNLIAKEEQLVGALTERYHALIRKSVCRGLRNGRTTESGVVWLGDVPQDWQVGQLKRFCSVIIGKMIPQGDVPGQARAPYMRAANVQPMGRLILDDVQEMPFSAVELEKFTLLTGDVVVVEGGAGYGRSGVLLEDLSGWGFQKAINRVRPIRGGDGRFVCYLLLAAQASGVFDTLINTATIPHLTAEKLEIVEVVWPGVDEQRQIADFLDRELAKNGRLVAQARDMLALLRERRAALISAAVTGKIDVSSPHPEGAPA